MFHDVNLENPIGSVEGIYVAKPKKVENAGVVTSILLYMLENKKVDGVVTARKVKGILGKILLIKTRDELLNTVGNCWSVVPYTMKLKDMLTSSNLNKIAFVGLPCQAQFLRHMKTFPLVESDFANKIYVIISLFCMGTFITDGFVKLIREYKISPEDVKNIDIDKDYLVIIHSDGEIKVPVDIVLNHIQHGCLLCPDYTGVFADISAGRAITKKGTLLITRSKLGDNIIKKASEEGYIEVESASEDEITKLKEKALEKLKRAMDYTAKLL